MLRRLCALLALLLAAGAALAEPAMPRVAFEEGFAPYAGEWVRFDDGFKLYLPGDWVSFEISQDEAAAGMFYRAGDGDAGVCVMYMRAGGLGSLEDLAADFERAGCGGIELLDINGIPAVGLEREGDYRGAAFFHPVYPGFALVVLVSPPSGEAAKSILSSLTPDNSALE